MRFSSGKVGGADMMRLIWSAIKNGRYNRWLYRSRRANRKVKLYTNIRPDLDEEGKEYKTSSGHVEKSEKVKK